METNSAHGTPTNGVFLEVKPEPTEISNIAQFQCATERLTSAEDGNLSVTEYVFIPTIEENVHENQNAVSSGNDDDVTPIYMCPDKMKTINEIESNETFLKVKQELTDTSNVVESLPINEYKDEISSFANMITAKEENSISISTVENMVSYVNIENFKLGASKTSSNVIPKASGRKKYTRTKSNYACSVCNKNFKTTFNVTKHMKSHVDERNHKCYVCKKLFKTKDHLTNHMDHHNDERNHKCEICSKTFKTRHHVVNHMQYHGDERSHKCDICAKTYKTRYDMLKHMKCHTDERNYKCDVCDKTFKTKDHRKHHMKIHTEERNYTCDVCGKSYKTRHNLRNHMLYHNSERKYKCNICMKGFKTKYDMVSHLKSHTDERNYKCSLCDKSFKSQDHVAKHMKCHTAERNHKCHICDKGFKAKSDVRKHMKYHTIDRRYKCKVCSKIFETKVNGPRRTRQTCLECEILYPDKNQKKIVMEQSLEILSSLICEGESIEEVEVKEYNVQIKEENLEMDEVDGTMRRTLSVETNEDHT